MNIKKEEPYKYDMSKVERENYILSLLHKFKLEEKKREDNISCIKPYSNS